MKKILFATNFSDSCTNAFTYLKEMVQQKSVVVDIIHVFQVAPTTLGVVPADTVSIIIEQRKEVINKRLGDLMEQLPPGQRGSVYAYYDFYTSSAITEIAQQNYSDLILMGLREKYSLIDRMMGTTTAYTIKESDIPVLAVPSDAKFEWIKDILFPTAITWAENLSDPEKKALEWLSMFSLFFQESNIHFLHVRKNANELDLIYKDKAMPKFDFTVSHANSVEEGILDNLKRTNSDIIVFYKPHRQFWERLFHSSITRKLLFQSRTPLLIF